MKTSNEEQHNNRKQNTCGFSDSIVFEARKMWASSECLGPYDVDQACRQTEKFLKKEAARE